MTLVEQFDQVVAAGPDAVAVEFGGTRTTYAELSAASKRFARHLHDSVGVRRGDHVVVCLEPGTELIVCLLGILRCGAAYVPLDVQNPPERNRLIVEDCRPRTVIDDVDTVRRMARPSPGRAADPPATSAEPDDVCYVIYTSGTTGLPKGVPISHRHVQALFRATGELFDVGAGDVWLLFHSVAFDFSVWELWGAVLSGARLLLIDRWTKLSPDVCADLIVDRRVTVLNQTPTAFSVIARALLERVSDPGELSLRYVIFGGERVLPAALRPWVRRFGLDRPELINMYGLTEATVHTTYRRLTHDDLAADDSVIGRPLPGFIARVVDEHGRSAARGELLVAGPQVAPGYLHRPDLTAERFISDPLGELTETHFYRTGDLVERRADGFVYLGRADRQVKIRGHRIELGEVEAAVHAVNDVAEACVLVAAVDGEPTLACAYTTRSGRPLAPRTLRADLRARVPQHMLPARFRWLDQMPLTVNGKTDIHVLKTEMESAYESQIDAPERGRPVASRGA